MQTTISWISLGITFLLTLCANLSFAQVTANFSASETSGCGLVQSNFTDLSSSTSGVIDSWSWDFGSSVSTIQHPGNVFSVPGVYTICLTVSTTTGATDTHCKTDYISVFTLPQPDFDVSSNVGCAPLDVTFVDLTSSASPIVNYIWGVGGTSGVIQDDGSLPSIENSYPVADTYSISLTIQDANGCTNSISKPGLINVLDNPVIEISPSNTFSCQAPMFVDFTNDNIQANTSYFWDFGNGQTFSGTTPNTIIYTQPGSYTVSVNAANSIAGCSSQFTLSETIEIGNPVNLSSDLQSVCQGAPVQFSDDSQDVAQSVIWDFGDGNTSNVANPTHSYAAPGCYTVNLTREVDGCSNTEVLGYCIQVNELPTGSFSVTNNQIGCSIPIQTDFVANASPGSTISWDFGDGNTGLGSNVSHTYTSFGNFEVVVTLITSDGCETILPAQFVNIQETRARIAFSDIRGCSPLSFALNENSMSVAPITDWYWEIIDDGATPPVIFSSADQNPFVTIADTGVFDVQLTVTNALGCTSTRRFDREIYVGIPPNTDFTFSPDSACRTQAVEFLDNSSTFADEWVWDFGDGIISYDQNPEHTYGAVGLFSVQLISFNNGCADTLALQDALEVLVPDARMTTGLFCDNLNLRTFKNSSNGADIYHWDFGDVMVASDTSSADSTSFTYPGPGSYTATLIVENLTTGCLDTTREEIIVTDLNPELEIRDSVGCAPFSLDLINTSTDAISYSWVAPGGDINSPGMEDPAIVYEAGGTYSNVEVEIIDVNGCIENLVLTTPIVVSELESALIPSTLAGCADVPVSFTNNSQSTYNNIISSEWIVGNNLDTFSSTDITYTFTEAGDYPISLKVIDDGGCETTTVHPQLINITNPESGYTSDLYSCTFAPLTFKGEGIGEQLNYTWSFGDGGTSSGDSVLHQYNAEGQYEICVSVIDKNGCTADTCGLENVIVLDPVAGFSVDNAYQACPPLLANFVNNSNNAINYSWDFGDNSGESILATPPHVYTDPGVYDVTLVAYTTELCTDTLFIPNYINLDGPQGDFNFSVSDNCAPGAVTFVGNSVEQYDYFWDYGDGNIDTTLNVAYDSIIYDYAEIGVFKPKLILVDNGACSRVIELPDSITMGGFNYDFNASDTLFCGNDPLTSIFVFNGETSEPLQETSWLFPGSSTPSSNVTSPIVTYPSPGEYDVQLILDNGSCRDTILKPNYIKIGAIPDAQIGMDINQGCLPLTVNFQDNSSISSGVLTHWNWDFEAAGNSTDENPAMIFTDPGNYTIDLEVTSDIGCSSTQTTQLEVFALPNAEIIGETNICVGERSTLEANLISTAPGSIITWSGGPIDGCMDCLITTVNPSVTTNYNLLVTDPNGCTTEEIYEVYVRTAIAPVIDLGTDTTICKGTDVLLNLSVDQSGTSINWDQNIDGLSCYTNCPNPIATPSDATTYFVEVENVDGCKSTDSIRVNLFEDERDFLGEDLTICNGSEIALNATYGTSPQWESNQFLSCEDCPDPIANPTSDTKFYLEVLSENDCLIKDSVTVLVQEPMAIEAGPTATACLNAGTEMQGEGIGIPTWSPAVGVTNINDLNTHVQPTVTTMYYLTLDDGICLNEDSVLVEVIEVAEVFTTGGAVCEGETFLTEAEGIADTYTWSDNNGPVAQGIEFETAPTTTTSYQVVGELDGCLPDTAYFEVQVNEIPEMDYPRSINILPGFSQAIEPRNSDTDNLEFTWTPAEGLSCTSCANPIAAPEETTKYSVDIFNPVTGCTTTEEIEVRLRTKCGEDLIGMANAFSPNGDGRNDMFHIIYSPVQEIKSFRIFDRWGNVHFQTDNLTEGWNGTFKGKKAMPGVYVYMIEAICPIDGSIFYKKGDLTLLR